MLQWQRFGSAFANRLKFGCMHFGRLGTISLQGQGASGPVIGCSCSQIQPQHHEDILEKPMVLPTCRSIPAWVGYLRLSGWQPFLRLFADVTGGKKLTTFSPSNDLTISWYAHQSRTHHFRNRVFCFRDSRLRRTWPRVWFITTNSMRWFGCS